MYQVSRLEPQPGGNAPRLQLQTAGQGWPSFINNLSGFLALIASLIVLGGKLLRFAWYHSQSLRAFNQAAGNLLDDEPLTEKLVGVGRQALQTSAASSAPLSTLCDKLATALRDTALVNGSLELGGKALDTASTHSDDVRVVVRRLGGILDDATLVESSLRLVKGALAVPELYGEGLRAVTGKLARVVESQQFMQSSLGLGEKALQAVIDGTLQVHLLNETLAVLLTERAALVKGAFDLGLSVLSKAHAHSGQLRSISDKLYMMLIDDKLLQSTLALTEKALGTTQARSLELQAINEKLRTILGDEPLVKGTLDLAGKALGVTSARSAELQGIGDKLSVVLDDQDLVKNALGVVNVTLGNTNRMRPEVRMALEDLGTTVALYFPTALELGNRLMKVGGAYPKDIRNLSDHVRSTLTWREQRAFTATAALVDHLWLKGDQILSLLAFADVLFEDANAVAKILKDLGVDAGRIARLLQVAFQRTVEDVEKILSAAGFANDEIHRVLDGLPHAPGSSAWTWPL